MDDDADILSDTSGLRDYIEVLRRRKWIVVIVTLVCVAITLAYSLNQPREYAATSYVRVPPPGGKDPLDALDPTSLNIDQQRQLMQDERAFGRGDAVRRSVRKQLGQPVAFDVDPLVNSTILTFTGRSGSGREASAIANTAASVYLQESLQSDVEALQDAIKAGDSAAKRMLDRIRELPRTSPTRGGLYQAAVALQQKVASARVRMNLMTDSGGALVALAPIPKDPVEPKTERNVAIAAILGLILGIAAAFVVDRLDDTLRTRRDLEVASDGRPILGQIPWVSTSRRASGTALVTLSEPRSSPTDAYRMLRTSVEILNLSSTQRIISVTSAKQAEGKSLTAANLAVVFGRADRRVAVVGCDFREPRLHEYFGLSNDVGLTSVLLGDATLESALRHVDAAPNVAVLPSGPTPPNPSEVLSLPAVSDVLTALNMRFDYVLIDTPPVLPVPDAVQIAAQVDGVIVVTLAKRTHKRELRRALEVLGQAEAPVVGTVFGGVARSAEYGYTDDTPQRGTWFGRLFRGSKPARNTAAAPRVGASQGNGRAPMGANGASGTTSEVGATGSTGSGSTGSGSA
jgi:capsular exopolysaccharide synthesis family protein